MADHYDVFISYKTKTEYASPLVEAIKKYFKDELQFDGNLSIFVDIEDDRHGNSFSDALKRTDVFIPIADKGYCDDLTNYLTAYGAYSLEGHGQEPEKPWVVSEIQWLRSGASIFIVHGDALDLKDETKEALQKNITALTSTKGPKVYFNSTNVDFYSKKRFFSVSSTQVKDLCQSIYRRLSEASPAKFPRVNTIAITDEPDRLNMIFGQAHGITPTSELRVAVFVKRCMLIKERLLEISKAFEDNKTKFSGISIIAKDGSKESNDNPSDSGKPIIWLHEKLREFLVEPQEIQCKRKTGITVPYEYTQKDVGGQSIALVDYFRHQDSAEFENVLKSIDQYLAHMEEFTSSDSDLTFDDQGMLHDYNLVLMRNLDAMIWEIQRVGTAVSDDLEKILAKLSQEDPKIKKIMKQHTKNWFLRGVKVC